MAFKIASSPHLSRHFNTSTLMQRVLLCALPGVAVQCYVFGWGTIIQILIAMTVAISSEAAVLRLRKRPVIDTLKDNSALLTALFIGIAIPSLAPWWLTVLGTMFAIVIVKHLYGGLGHNIFNPAMAAYVMLLISFPVQMTSWVTPSTLLNQPIELLASLQIVFLGASSSIIDGIAMATPLDTLKTDLAMGLTSHESLAKPVFSDGFGVGWLWINLAYLAGGLIMLKLKLIRWHITVGLLASLFVCASIGFLLNPDTHAGPLLHLFSGATMLAAFFIATDPVTAATSVRGRLIFGALIGLLVYIIRTYGGYPDAYAFAILLANLCAPFIDHYMKPRAYGHRAGS